MTTLSDAALLAAEEAYDNVIRSEGSRSPYMNTRAFRAAFHSASAMSASGQDAEERLEAKPASAAPKEDAR